MGTVSIDEALENSIRELFSRAYNAGKRGGGGYPLDVDAEIAEAKKSILQGADQTVIDAARRLIIQTNEAYDRGKEARKHEANAV